MTIRKVRIAGQAGRTILYSFAPTVAGNVISWPAWRFYTPVGPLVDEHGLNYFDVPADALTLEPDDEIGKLLLVKVTAAGVEQIEIYDGTAAAAQVVGIEGDFVITGYIPSTSSGAEPDVIYKEIFHG